tara:strand:- start:448 stop:669 length:222 start_codon:yes stop_codon:yes gene_type:complete
MFELFFYLSISEKQKKASNESATFRERYKKQFTTFLHFNLHDYQLSHHFTSSYLLKATFILLDAHSVAVVFNA